MDEANEALIMKTNDHKLKEAAITKNGNPQDDSEANDTTTETKDEDDVVTTTQSQAPPLKKKKYRKKVRSKQKNIRKDHRDVKPLHLLSQLRPMTVETRAKLQTPKILLLPNGS